MKKFSLAVAIVVMGLAMASCGNKEKELMQKATEFYTQNETELKAVDNVEGFAAFCQNFKQKLNDFKATYSDMNLSQETQNFLADKEKALKQLGTQKADELFTPCLEKLESFNIMRNIGVLSSIEDEDWNKMNDEKAEKILSLIGIKDASSEEEAINAMKNQMSAVSGIDPAASDEEFGKAFNNWFANTIGIKLDASDEEFDKAMGKWSNDLFGTDLSTISKEEKEQVLKDWKSKNNTFFDNMEKSSEVMSKELKERGEKLKEDMELTYEILID